MAERPRAFRLALSTVWPGLRYMGLGFWAAWLFLVSNGSIWLSDVEVNGIYPAYLMLVMTITGTVVCLLATQARALFERILAHRHIMMGIASLATVGAALVIIVGPYYLVAILPAWLFYFGAFLIGVYSAVFILKCGQVFGELPPRRVLIYSLLSEVLMVALCYFVLGNGIYAPIPGGPSLSGILAFTLLPLIATYLVCLPKTEPLGGSNMLEAGTTEVATAINNTSEATTANPGFTLGELSAAFWKFLLVIFIFTVASEAVRCYFVFIRMPAITYVDSILVLLLRLLFALIVLAFAMRSRRRLYFSKLYLVSLVVLAVVIALIPLLQVFSTLLGSLIGFAANIMSFLIWCLLAFAVHEKKVSALIVFGYGRTALLAGQACGWVLGIWALPSLTDSRWEIVCFVGLAIAILVTATLFFSEKHFDQLFGEVARLQINLETLFFSPRQRKDRRPWYDACRRVGKQAALSHREQEILELVANGHSPDYIADRLVVSLGTVRTHIRNIYGKFGVHNKSELIACIEAELQKDAAPFKSKRS